MALTLVLGGARSGKSRHAQRLAEQAGGRRVFIATAEPIDDEMADRIARHRADRGAGWTTVEAPLDLVDAVHRHAAADAVLLVDCVTVWLGNLLHHELDVTAAIDGLVGALSEAPGQLIIVSNEVGLAIVPETPLGRRFRDLAGLLNQRLAATAGHAVLVVAGIALSIK